MEIIRTIFLDDFLFFYFGIINILNFGFILCLIAKMQGQLI